MNSNLIFIKIVTTFQYISMISRYHWRVGFVARHSVRDKGELPWWCEAGADAARQVKQYILFQAQRSPDSDGQPRKNARPDTSASPPQESTTLALLAPAGPAETRRMKSVTPMDHTSQSSSYSPFRTWNSTQSGFLTRPPRSLKYASKYLKHSTYTDTSKM